MSWRSIKSWSAALRSSVIFFTNSCAGILRPQQSFARPDHLTHLGVGDDVVVHDGGDAVDRFRAAGGRRDRGDAEEEKTSSAAIG